MSTINRVAHGLVAGDRVVFSNLVGGSPIDVDTVYSVLSAGLTADAFQISELDGGTPLTFATLTSADMQVVPEEVDEDPDSDATYVDVTDVADVHAPPTPVPVPSAPTVTSSLSAGLVRLNIELNDTAEAKVREWQVQVTNRFDPGTGDPDWTTPISYTLPEGSIDISLPAMGGTSYAVRVNATDVYGNESGFSTEVEHVTMAGSDALAAALASLANDVSDGIITETKIADNSISTPKLMAGAVTAEILAATIVLASLIKTANSGRRIEIDVDGIRLYDASEELQVRIPTNGDPVFVKGEITADSLVSQSTASFRGIVDLAGNSISTLQNGISDPTIAPGMTASTPSLGLTGTALPSSAKGICYDSGAGTYWVAVDPASGYVAYEYNATTGAFVRRIPATGSTSTITDTVGSTSHISDGANGRDGNTDSHFATPLTVPSGKDNPRITKVAVWMAGHSGSCSTRVAVYSDVSGTGNVLRESATFTAADEGATGVGDSNLYDRTLSSELSVTSGSTYYFGCRHTSSSEGFQWDFDSGSSKNTYLGDTASDADGTGWGLFSSSQKPNVYFTYKYDVDTRLETAPMIGVATDGTYVYTLDTLGQVWKYDRTTMAYVAKSGVQTAITGTKTQAGLFWDATASELIITTTTGTGAGVYPKCVRVDESTLAVSSTVYSAAAGPTFSGTTDTFRGGARVNDPLNASAATYWLATTSAVYAYTFSGTTLTNTANRDFGLSTTMGDGLTYNSTSSQFRGFDAANLTKIWRFTDWDWTTASAIYWAAYTWYDSNASGGTHETGVSPRVSLTLRRREQVSVTQPGHPSGGVDDPDSVRIYFLPNATDPGTGASYKRQTTDALTSRILETYDSGGGANPASSNFPAGTPAELKSAGVGFILKGSGLINRTGTAFPSAPSTNDHFWRSDLRMDFFYDGTRWLSCTLYDMQSQYYAAGATYAVTIANTQGSVSRHNTMHPQGTDIWLEDATSNFFISGGTALSASHKWEGDINKVDVANNPTTIGTFVIDTGTLANWLKRTVVIDALLGTSATYPNIRMDWTKTGTPGTLNFTANIRISYRVVQT